MLSQTETSADENTPNFSNYAQSNPSSIRLPNQYPEYSEQNNFNPENGNMTNNADDDSEIPINPTMDFNADGTFHTQSAGNNNYQMPNNMFNGFNNGVPNPNNHQNNNSWMKCSPNCCWYSYTNCTHWNPLNCNNGYMNSTNVNGNYE